MLGTSQRRLQSGSINLVASIVLRDGASESDANVVSNIIETTPTTTMQTQWFAALPVSVTIENTPTSSAQVVEFVSPSPPLLPPPPPEMNPFIIPATAMLCALCCVLGCLAWLWDRWGNAAPVKVQVHAAGKRVRITGVVSRKSLNDTCGRVVYYDTSSGLYCVALESSGEKIFIRRDGAVAANESRQTPAERRQAWIQADPAPTKGAGFTGAVP